MGHIWAIWEGRSTRHFDVTLTVEWQPIFGYCYLGIQGSLAFSQSFLLRRPAPKPKQTSQAEIFICLATQRAQWIILSPGMVRWDVRWAWSTTVSMQSFKE